MSFEPIVEGQPQTGEAPDSHLTNLVIALSEPHFPHVASESCQPRWESKPVRTSYGEDSPC